jgi:predicted CDP-diglyceride synthetase/phosphatidate cytidylyltransferase
MSIQWIGLFVASMLMAIVASFGPIALAAPARALFAIGLLTFLGGIVVRGIRRPVV